MSDIWRSRTWSLISMVLQELDHGGRVEEEDMARLIQQLEHQVSTEVKVLCGDDGGFVLTQLVNGFDSIFVAHLCHG